MRCKPVILVLALSVAATAAWFLAGQKTAVPTDLQPPPGADEAADANTINASPETTPAAEAPKEHSSPPSAGSEGITGLDQGMTATPEATQEAYVAKRVVELQDLGMENDPASLDTILSELNNSDPGIRQAAVEAAVQFGSRDAIPRLMDAAAQTDDLQEKSAILAAIEFLKLPTLSEALAQETQPVPAASSGTRSNP